MMGKPLKILLLHLVSNGDCLYVTAIAKQIKLDFPNCHLTWMISNLSQQVLIGNPHVDETIVVAVKNVKAALGEDWFALRKLLSEEHANLHYDIIIPTQFFPENFANYDGTIRSTLFRSYPWGKIKDVTPQIFLTGDEVAHVNQFIENKKVAAHKIVALFECSPGSGQSFVTPELAVSISNQLVAIYPKLLIILSTHLAIDTKHDRIIVANELSFRENAELAKHCDLFIGASSGITWLCTSSWVTRKLPMIQLLKKARGIGFASVVYDFKYWGLNTDHITEIYTNDVAYIVGAVKDFLDVGMDHCRNKYHQNASPNPFYIIDYFNMLAKKGRVKPLFGLFKNFKERNGMSLMLILAFIYIFFQGALRLPFVAFKILLKSK